MATVSVQAKSASSTFTEERQAPLKLRLSEIISTLSYALDLTEGQPMGHSVRSCILGMRIADEIGLTTERKSNLYYSLLLKDAGCSSNASRMYSIFESDDLRAKRDSKTTDWTRVTWESLQYALRHVRSGRSWRERVAGVLKVAWRHKRDSRELVQIRCERGAMIARRIGLPEETAAAIHSLDEHWNGQGYPDGLQAEEIPLLARIMNLSQTLEVFSARRGPKAAIQVTAERNKRWFDPQLVRAVHSIAKRGELWTGLYEDDVKERAVSLEPISRFLIANEAAVDNICEAFADVIDAKSPFTYQHSTGVAQAAVTIAQGLDLEQPEVTMIRRAALLHDIGKLAVPNSILEKPGKPTEQEWAVIRQHPYFTQQILQRIPGFEELTYVASVHHERLDGTGYFQGLTARDLTLPARILCVADVFDALAAKRPYRDALPLETVFRILRKDAPHALDATCVETLASCLEVTSRPGAWLPPENVMAMAAKVF
ncbi:MAG: HD-GYP domain-containing protein [Terriglobia bacterium]